MLAARDDPAREREFFQALFDAEVLIPVPGPPPANDRLMSAPPGSEIDLPVLEGQDRSFVPVFSSMRQLLMFVPKGTGYMQIAMSSLVDLWPDDVWMALNLKGDIGTALSPMQVKGLPTPVRRPVDTATKDRDFVVGRPKEEPVELLSTLSRFAERTPDIVALYRALLLAKGEDEHPRIVIGVHLERDADKDKVLAMIGDAGRESGIPSFMLLPVYPDAPEQMNQVGRWMLADASPFYRRAES